MGIKDLNKILRKHSPDAVYRHGIWAWRGHRVAIDVSTILYADFSVAWSSYLKTIDLVSEEPQRNSVITTFLDLFLKSVSRFLSVGITPILVFDGEAPAEKDQCHVERKAIREKTENEIKALRLSIDNVLDCGKEVNKKFVTLYSRLCSPGKDLEHVVYELCTSLGLPCLKAKTEAERLCSWLVTRGFASACFSTDTDNLVHGCDVLINRTSFGDVKLRNDEVIVYELVEVLKGLDMSLDQFKDLCVLLSCDYNTNMPGFGPVKSLALLKKYGSIEKIKSEGNYDIECLNYESCMRLFDREVDGSELYDGVIDEELVTIKREALSSVKSVLDELDLTKWLSNFESMYTNFDIEDEVYDEFM